MGCGRCGGRRSVSAPSSPPPVRTARTPPPAVQPRTPPPPSARGACEKCGWQRAKIRYIDVRTNQRVDKWTCPNHKCPNYNQ